jgi:hypothetical protein
VDPRRLVRRVVERGAVVVELFPQRLLSLGLIEVGRRRAGVLPLLLRARSGAIGGEGGGAVARDDEASTPCVGCRGITQPSTRITNNPAAGSVHPDPIQAAGRRR